MSQPESGFGINTNLLQTNVLNIAVVIGVLFYLGKDTVTNLLQERRSRIVQSIEDADNRYRQAQQRLEQAQEQLRNAQNKAEEIKSQGDTQVEEAKQALLQQAEEQMDQLEASSKSSLKFAEQQAFQQIQKRLTEIAFEKAKSKLQQKLSTKSVQTHLINYQIKQLRS